MSSTPVSELKLNMLMTSTALAQYDPRWLIYRAAIYHIEPKFLVTNPAYKLAAACLVRFQMLS
jgi:hypothetical protein